MELGDKIRYLREVEGALRGLDRAMTQREIVHAIKKDLKKTISQSYLSQIESGARPHLTNTSRMLLAKFFKVHPGYLVDDPEGYSTELDLRRRRARRQDGSLADRRRGAFPQRSRRLRGVVETRPPSRFAPLPDASRPHTRKPGPGRTALRRPRPEGGASMTASLSSFSVASYSASCSAAISFLAGSLHLHFHGHHVAGTSAQS